MLHEYWIDPSFFVVVENQAEREEDSLWFIRYSENGEWTRMEEVPDVPYNWD